jgi:predicted RNA-binding Zn-ribbon protein involved in translation (DUF1610 family)
MSNGSIVLYFVLLFGLIPVFFWYRVSYVKRRIDTVKSKCSKCGNVQRLASVMDYECSKCGEQIKYLDEHGDRIMINTYECYGCGSDVIEGIITCTSCGLEALPDDRSA